MSNMKFFIVLMFLFTLTNTYAQDKAIPIEAEDADVIGSDFNVLTDGDITYLTPATDFAGATNPGSSDKILTFQITFEAPGTYDLYVKVRVGPNGANDDSFYFASGFGTRPVDIDSYWIRVNNIGNGASGSNEYVLTPDENSTGNGIFKWINASETGEGSAGGTIFTVEADSLTKTFQIGSRENGLDLDKIAFGNSELFYTVSNLENGESGVSEIPETGAVLIVDLADSIREVTHAASGALYGITETLPGNIESNVDPLNPYVFVQPALSGTGHQQPFGSAIQVSERLSTTSGQVMIRLADICPGWPYQWPGETSWNSQVTSVINDKIQSGRDNYYGYEIWNEHHGTWNESTNGNFFTVLWKPTYDLIRSLDPDAKIIGPSDSYYSRARIQEFLQFCKDNDCLPDIICWHELQGSDNVSSHVDDYRSLERDLRISTLEISINEYSHNTHEYEGCPGVSVPFIAKFERKKVQSASISWWFTSLPGRLGSLLTSRNQTGGGWWLYKWYGDMKGYMANVTPPSESGDGLDGFANLDMNSEIASVCLGGDYTGMADVEINGIPSSFGDSVDVKVEYVPWTNKDNYVEAPVIVSNSPSKVTNGSITVPVEIIDPLYGYRVSIGPSGNLVAVETLNENLPDEFELNQNYPNPFNPATTISFNLPDNKFVSLKVYNLLGQEISELAGKVYPAGNHKVTFESNNLTSGIYFYTLRAGRFIMTKKMLLIK